MKMMMMMNQQQQQQRFWTFNSLVCAFIDLFIAYFLLFGSTIGFFGVNFLQFLGFSFPTNSELKTLVVDKVSSVELSVIGKFPFDSVFKKGKNGLNMDTRELEGEACCSSKSDAPIWIEKERGGFDMKGKGGFRRRRKGSFDSTYVSCCSTNWITPPPPPEDLLSDEAEVVKSEADKDRMIVLLNRELEKERNAAATAADEAMSMILRLQEEKASIQMESRQYQRMIEEKSAYDEEEMNILKEILLRREREKHFLQKQVDQFYHQNSTGGGYEEEEDVLRQHEVDRWLLPEKTIATVGEEKEDLKNQTYLHVIEPQPASSTETNVTSSGLPPISSSKTSLRRNSTSAIDNERTKLDTEVDWLRERLRIVQQGRDKLNFSIDNREKESLQLQLLEDIARQLQDIRMLTQPHRTSRQASLPLPSSKGVTKKRRCRSASTGPAKSS